MSNKALDWAWSVQGLNPVEKLVLVALADHANAKTLQCNPGLECLRKRTCASLRGIQNAIGKLIGRGLIGRDLRRGIGATYTLITPAVSAGPTQAISARVTPANGHDSAPPPRQSVPRTPAVSASEPLREPKKEKEGDARIDGKEGSEASTPPPEPLADPAEVRAAVGGYLGRMRGRIAAAPGCKPHRTRDEQLEALAGDGPPTHFRPGPVEPVRSVEEQLAILLGTARPPLLEAFA